MILEKVLNEEIINKTYQIDSKITKLSKGVFAFCSELEEIAIPDHIIEIPDEAFMYCFNLKKIDLNNVKKIGNYAFAGCTNLSEIKGLENVVDFGIYCFAGCASLEKAILSDQLTRLREGMFESCLKLEKIKFLKVKEIESLVFSGCASLKEIVVSDEIEKIIGDAFLATDGLNLVYQKQIIDNFDDIDSIVRKNGKLDVINEQVKKKILEKKLN